MIRMSTFLIGYRGSGKTTIGKRLADRLWQSFVDIDDLIVKSAEKTIKDIFEQDGEPAFRDLEEKAVRQAIEMPEHVIALGGGSVLREANRTAIKASGQKVIYLKCTPGELHKRIAADPQTAASRPSLTHLGGTVEEIEKLLAEREPLYRQVMTSELDVTRLTPEEAVVYLARMI
jgi:shikimate kinase